ncbi:MAG: UDP-N-acetylmuramate dehydrogenase [Lachnospiraceae bacterium]|nr:UDP-N-acetylmuramate dehydrogenase [Lachnospiraceae bacterium]
MNNRLTLLKEKLPQMKVKEGVLLSSCTSFRTGGPADLAAYPGNSKELGELLRLCRQEGVPCYILGNGTNVLAPDEGFRGVVILTSEMREISIKEETGNDEETGIEEETGINDGTTGNDEVTGIKDGTTGINDEKTWIVKAGAGVLLSTLSMECAKRSLTGLEYARGIPGSVGGAVVMNAGAYGGEVKDSLIGVTVMSGEGGEPFKMKAEELELGYRHSIIPERGLVVLEAEFELAKGDHDSIFALMDELSARRKEKQPLEYPSAGSTFKRPEGYFAGKLIEDAGLKGFSVGGAQVSEKHAGFVINKGGATSADIMNLIKEVQRRVYEASGVMLEPEVKFME